MITNLAKYYLKFTNKQRYQTEKEIARYERANRKFCESLTALPKAKQANLTFDTKYSYTFKHSGNCGDIIYALPAMMALAGKSDINLHLHLHQPANYSKTFQHPLGKVMLNESSFENLKPLLLAQPRIKTCSVYSGEAIDFNFDIIRDHPFPLSYGNISRWYFLTFAVNADLGKPWLQVQANADAKDAIVIARSLRYHSPGIDYAFLNDYDNLLFVGLKDEFADMRKKIPRIQYQPVQNFLELAEIIAGCKFFIGNQSFPFSIAEALKVKRLLEVCFHCPNVSVEGSNGFDFCYQPQFEKLIEKLYYAS